jgi:hypothetical protein
MKSTSIDEIIFYEQFLAVASGIDKHGLNSPLPIAYTHLDIAGNNQNTKR